MILIIPMKPVPKKAPEYGNRRMYSIQAEQVREARLHIKSQLRGKKPLTGAVRVNHTFVMKMPKNISKKKRADMLSGKIRPTIRPDRDNLMKFINDCMNGLVYLDDKQDVEGEGSKIYGEVPQIIVEVIEI